MVGVLVLPVDKGSADVQAGGGQQADRLDKGGAIESFAVWTEVSTHEGVFY